MEITENSLDQKKLRSNGNSNVTLTGSVSNFCLSLFLLPRNWN